ncbi:MAG: hypothetical protein ACYC3Q_14525 [Gemmatimonadaceae bacterium]
MQHRPGPRRCDAGYLLYIHAKNEQGDLAAAQARTLARLVKEEFG